MDRHYYVYILTNKTHSVLYTGVTGNLAHRLLRHRLGTGGSFTQNYRTTKLVHVELFSDVHEAIRREKQIKAGSRKKKLALIRKNNPYWKDLAREIR